MEISFTKLKAEAATFTLEIDNWVIGQHAWGVFSTEGDIGSLLANLLCRERIAHYQQDSLASIDNYLQFIANKGNGGYKVELSQSSGLK